MKLKELKSVLLTNQKEHDADILLYVPDGSGKPGHVVCWHTTEAHRTRLMNGRVAIVIDADRPATPEELGK